MRNLKVMFSIVLILLLVGCASSTSKYDYLNPTHKFINMYGNKYRVPINAQHYQLIDSEEAKIINNLYDINSKKGDIWWYTKDAYSEIYKSFETKDADRYYKALDKYIPKKEIDIVSPLTKKQIEYYKQDNARRQQLIQSELEYLRQKSLIREMNRPKTYNVNVFHY